MTERYGGIKTYWHWEEVPPEAPPIAWRRLELQVIKLRPSTWWERVCDRLRAEAAGLWRTFWGMGGSDGA